MNQNKKNIGQGKKTKVSNVHKQNLNPDLPKQTQTSFKEQMLKKIDKAIESISDIFIEKFN